jgi:hypothetical protein
MVRTVTVSLSDRDIDTTTETLLFNAIQHLDRLCDSLLRCRVEIDGGIAVSDGQKPWRVRLLLSTSEHDIFMEGQEQCGIANSARGGILSAVQEAANALYRMKTGQAHTASIDHLEHSLPVGFAS